MEVWVFSFSQEPKNTKIYAGEGGRHLERRGSHISWVIGIVSCVLLGSHAHNAFVSVLFVFWRIQQENLDIRAPNGTQLEGKKSFAPAFRFPVHSVVL